jgi:hypothetical protein
MSSWLRQIRTTSRIVKLLLQFPGWDGPLERPQSRESRVAPTCCCGTATLNNYRRVRPASRPIQPFCDLRATATSPVTRYGARHQSAWLQTTSTCDDGVRVSEGRLFGLTPFDWAVLLVGMIGRWVCEANFGARV